MSRTNPGPLAMMLLICSYTLASNLSIQKPQRIDRLGKKYEPIDCSRGESQELNFRINAQLVFRLIVLAIVP